MRKRYVERVVDAGIAEQHAVSFAAGLALNDMRPIVAMYSTFLQRAYDQDADRSLSAKSPGGICCGSCRHFRIRRRNASRAI